MKHIIIAPEGAPADALQAFVVPDTRAAIEMAVDAFIARLDQQDGDVDLEDSEAGMSAIDARGRYLDETKMGFAPNGEPSGHVRTENSELGPWPEWHTRGRRKTYGGAEAPGGGETMEDTEDDDAKEADGDETDGNFAEDEPAASHQFYGSGPGCMISDPDYGGDDDAS